MKREKTGFFAEDCQFLSLLCEKKKKKQPRGPEVPEWLN